MDEETFDTERAVDCCDSNCYADGSTIPVCNYNVLYRETEARFTVQPATWGTRRGGQRTFNLPVLRSAEPDRGGWGPRRLGRRGGGPPPGDR